MRPTQLRIYAKNAEMPQMIEALSAFNHLKETGDIIEYRDPADKRRFLCKDNRTQFKEGCAFIKPFFVNNKSAYICCSYCGEIHNHGPQPGYRAPHCLDKRTSDYYLDF